MTDTTQRHIIAVLVENESGALARIAGLFSARGYNIESLNVAPTLDPSMSRLTLVTSGSDAIIEQITKHLNRLVDVVKLCKLPADAATHRELALVKLRTSTADAHALAAEVGGQCLNDGEGLQILALTAAPAEVDAQLAHLTAASDVCEVVRSGQLGIGNGTAVLTPR